MRNARSIIRPLVLLAAGLGLLAAAGCSATAPARHPASTAGIALRDKVATHITPVSVENRNISLVRSFYRVVFNEHRLNMASHYLRLDYIQHTPSVPQGLDGFIYFYRAVFFNMFPDVRVKLIHIIAAGDRVQTFAIWRGHQAGTGKPLILHTADIYRVQGGKLAEHWDTIDGSGLLPFGFPPPTTDEPASPVVTDGSRAAAANVRLLRNFWHTIFVRHDVAAVPDFYSVRNFHEYIAQMCPSAAAFEACFRLYSRMFPDLRVHPTQIIANRDWVVAFLTWRGHEAMTERPLFLHCADLYRVVNGRFTEHWNIMDFSTIEQFGIVPPPSYLR